MIGDPFDMHSWSDIKLYNVFCHLLHENDGPDSIKDKVTYGINVPFNFNDWLNNLFTMKSGLNVAIGYYRVHPNSFHKEIEERRIIMWDTIKALDKDEHPTETRT